jgi:hypothetical protein
MRGFAMSVDLLAEHRLSLTELSKQQRIAVSTIWRWAIRGIRGHRLECFSLGGRRYTTHEAFARFVARTNGEKVVNGQLPRQREAAIREAERDLDRLGA